MKTIKNVLLAFVAVTAASSAFAAPVPAASAPSCCPNGACCASGVCCAPAGKTVEKATVKAKAKTAAPAPAKTAVARADRK